MEPSADVFVGLSMNGCNADKAAFVFLTLYQAAVLAELHSSVFWLEEESLATDTWQQTLFTPKQNMKAFLSTLSNCRRPR